MIRLMAALATALLVLAGCNGDDGDGSTAAFCELADEVQSFDEFGEGIDPSDFGALTDQIDEFNRTLDEAVDRAPDEIRADVELVATAVSEMFEAMRGPLQELTENPEAAAQNPEIFQQLQEAAPSPEEQEELEEASQRIEDFVEEECGIDVDSDGDTDGGEDQGGDPNPLSP